ENMDILVDTLEKMKINILYTIGGDGTLKGAHRISEMARARGLDLAVIGVPKTIDNDISFIQRSFGFETAFSRAGEAILAAHVEAKGAPNGIGLVKLMGRHSGFIAANAALAMNDVNVVLVPEEHFDLDGPRGLLAHLKDRIVRRGHAVLCVAEGAGQDLLENQAGPEGRDASGNLKLGDIGLFLKDQINSFFKKEGIEINLKYIDPSYMIRSAPAVPGDSVLCALLGQNAVHAGMAGKTDMIIGIWNNIYTHVPIELAISKRKQIDPHSKFWYSVLTATGQPLSMKNH
ncbi:MAG TPA: ATP-dependent 6-phosphofructokinase, partial [Spirochaetota bacterium]|nr:ATP-dependent 6-phosphofructokinase [Spirochaetota bacterium]